MNREIMFRGKRIDNGEWVEGYFFKWPCVSWKELSCVIVPVIGLENGIAEQAIVDPATVGQSTGLTDKNGKRIFEGDIVSFNYDTSSVEMTDGCWGLDDGGTLLYDLEELKVIGNIHDNPELLEGEDG